MKAETVGMPIARERTRCRNPRCGCKIKEPTSNPKAAFCAKGCFTSFYRSRCIVCERSYRRTREDQHTCGRRKCKAELRRHRERFFGKWAGTPGESLSTPRNPIKSGIKTRIESLRGWSWIRLPGDDDDWELFDREGRLVARVRQDGELHWVARPRCLPEPPLEDLDEARSRAELLALWNLPAQWTPQKDMRRHKQAASVAMIQRDDVPVNVIGGYRFPSSRQIDLAPLAPSASVHSVPRIRLVHDRGRFAQAVSSRWQPAGKGDDVPGIPAFLDRRISSAPEQVMKEVA
jgi:hypothetical protein